MLTIQGKSHHAEQKGVHQPHNKEGERLVSLTKCKATPFHLRSRLISGLISLFVIDSTKTDNRRIRRNPQRNAKQQLIVF